uniref:c-type cytochrome n=1 Tax=Altererythrobacter segetis TaxID=1104773 RepID=UPI00140DF1D0|nr:c-type cytochrome [Altererythrobacter segetis]
MISRFALAAALALGLTACGSQSEPSGQPSATDAPPAAAASAPAETATETATPTEAASATPTPTPSAKASGTSTPQPAASGAGAADAPPQAFNQCTACHSTAPGKTIIGPSLAGIYGREAGEVKGFEYSDAMEHSNLRWNAANLDAFLANPAGKVPGTLMGFAGIKDAAQRKAVIDYLKTL